MIKLYHYSENFDEILEEADLKIYLELQEHEDVMQDTVVAAVEDGEFLGIGYLMAGPSFRVLRRKLPYYHVHMVFKAFPQEDPEREVEVSAYLLGYLTNAFVSLQEKYPDKHLILRTFASAEDTAYVDFLSGIGFTASRVMLKMQQDLVYDPEEAFPGAAEYFEDESFRVCLLDPEDEVLKAQYFKENEKVFMVPDSPAELSFRMNECNARVYLLMKGDTIISSVSTWNMEAPEELEYPDRMIATENIFTAKRFQKKGYMEYLLQYVLHALAEEDASMVSLNVYADDTPAICLYQKLEYETIDEILEMHFEVEPEYIPY